VAAVTDAAAAHASPLVVADPPLLLLFVFVLGLGVVVVLSSPLVH